MYHASTQSKVNARTREYLGVWKEEYVGFWKCLRGKDAGRETGALKKLEKKKIYHGILLRDTLVLSCLLIKALICLAEGKEAGMCADIIAKLKAMPSGSWASTMLYLQELPGSVARRLSLFICFHPSSAVTQQTMTTATGKNRGLPFFAKDDTSHVRIDHIHHLNYLPPPPMWKNRSVPLGWHLRQFEGGLRLAAGTTAQKVQLQLLFIRTASVEGHLSPDRYIFRSKNFSVRKDWRKGHAKCWIITDSNRFDKRMIYLWALRLTQNVGQLIRPPQHPTTWQCPVFHAANMSAVITAFVGDDVTNIVRTIRG